MTTTSHTPEPLEGPLKDAVRAARDAAPPSGFGAKTLAEAASWKKSVSVKPLAPPAPRGPLLALLSAAIAASLFFLWLTGAPPRKTEYARGPKVGLEQLTQSMGKEALGQRDDAGIVEARVAEASLETILESESKQHFGAVTDSKTENFKESLGVTDNIQLQKLKSSGPDLRNAQLDDGVREEVDKKPAVPDMSRFSRSRASLSRSGAPPAENKPQDPEEKRLSDKEAVEDLTRKAKDADDAEKSDKLGALKNTYAKKESAEDRAAKMDRLEEADAENKKMDRPLGAASRAGGVAGFGGGGSGRSKEVDRAPPASKTAEAKENPLPRPMGFQLAEGAKSAKPLILAPGGKGDESDSPAPAPAVMPAAPVTSSLAPSSPGESLFTVPSPSGGARSAGASPSRRMVVAADATILFTTGDDKPINFGDEIAYSSVNLLHVMDWSKEAKSEILGDIGPDPFTVTPDGKTVLSSTGALFESSGQKVARLSNLESKGVRALTTSPDGKTLLTQHVAADFDCYYRVAEFPSGEEKFKLTNQWGYTFAAGFAPDNTALALMDKAKIVNEFSLTDGAKLKSYEPAHVNSIRAIDYSPNGKMLASTGTRGETYLFNREDAKLIHKLEITQTPSVHALDGLSAIRFSPDSRFLAASGSSNLFFWSVATGKVAAQLPRNSGGAIHLRYSPDGTKITAVKDFVGVQDAEGKEALKYPTFKEWDVPSEAR